MILTTKEIKSLIQEELNKFLNESSSLDQELKKKLFLSLERKQYRALMLDL